MKKTKRLFKPVLKLFTKNESVNPDRCIAYSIYLPWLKYPVARLELTAQQHNGLYEIVHFYVYEQFAGMGAGRYLLELAERQIRGMGVDTVMVSPAGIVVSGRHIPKLTDDEMVSICQHFGFLQTDTAYMVKKL